MTGSNESMFLNTIRSRCMKIAFNKIQDILPNNFIQLEQMPFTANGKIDRVTLKKTYQESKK